jgi:hypothetical protein
MSVSAVGGLRLPEADGAVRRYVLAPPRELASPNGARPRSRVCFAAAHVVAADPLATGSAPRDPVDWDGTMAYRRHLWSCGLGVAEAMDTAQRGMGLEWPAARELMWRAATEARAVGGLLACGAGTDQLDADTRPSLEEVRDAYLEQCAFVEDQGAIAVVMASRALAAAATGPDDYRSVYDPVLDAVGRPVILHWLGEAFDSALAGYWGSPNRERAAELVVELIADHAARVDGLKVSVLDPRLEVALRRALPNGVRLYTGDDFNYPELIRGDAHGASDAMLGILDAIAPVAAPALCALDDGDLDRYDALLAPTVPFARHVFGSPTRYYKTGLVFLAYLNGHQDHWRMLGSLEGGRSIVHLAQLFRLADRAGLLGDQELAATRMRSALEFAGIEQ